MLPSSPPPSRLPGLILVLGIGLFFLGLIALLIVALSVFSLPTPTPIGPTSTLSAAEVPTTNRLAVIDHNQIYTVNPDGSQRLAFQPAGDVPTAALEWSRDGRRLIYVEVESRASRVVSAQIDGSAAISLFEGTRAAAPFYLNGAPDDQHIAILAPDDVQGMALRVAPLDQAQADRVAVNGEPNYASWSPDGAALVVHIGGVTNTAFIGTYALSSTLLTTFTRKLAAFQAPSWSPSGEAQWLYARQTATGNELVVGNGRQASALVQFEEGIAFSWSPDGQHVAYALNTTDSFIYKGLVVIDRASRRAQTYHKSDLLAFFWSPDGQRLAFLTGAFAPGGQVGGRGGLAAPRVPQRGRPQRGRLEVTWHVIDMATGAIVDLSTFEPSTSFLYVLQYFDQFAQSIAVWSPDSRRLVYTGQPLIGEPGVYVIDVQQPAAPPQYVGSGEFAIWSWK